MTQLVVNLTWTKKVLQKVDVAAVGGLFSGGFGGALDGLDDGNNGTTPAVRRKRHRFYGTIVILVTLIECVVKDVVRDPQNYFHCLKYPVNWPIKTVFT